MNFAVPSCVRMSKSRLGASFPWHPENLLQNREKQASSADDECFFANSTFRRPTTSSFHRFSRFVGQRQTVFIVFYVSSADDGRFFANSAFRRPTMSCFHRFSRFVGRRRAITLFFLLFYASTTPFLLLEHATGRGTEWTALFE